MRLGLVNLGFADDEGKPTGASVPDEGLKPLKNDEEIVVTAIQHRIYVRRNDKGNLTNVAFMEASDAMQRNERVRKAAEV